MQTGRGTCPLAWVGLVRAGAASSNTASSVPGCAPASPSLQGRVIITGRWLPGQRAPSSLQQVGARLGADDATIAVLATMCLDLSGGEGIQIERDRSHQRRPRDPSSGQPWPVRDSISSLSRLLQAAIVGVVIVLSRRGVIDPGHRRKQELERRRGGSFRRRHVLRRRRDPAGRGRQHAGRGGSACSAWRCSRGSSFTYARSSVREGPTLSTAVLRKRTANLAMITQNVQWLVLIGSSFVISVYLQVVRGFSAIDTGLVFTSATAGVLVSSLAAEPPRQAPRQSTLIRAGFLITIAGHRPGSSCSCARPRACGRSSQACC